MSTQKQNQEQQRELRNALGTFATGITVVTTMNNQGQPVGMTVNSFSSVSLEPPLILWSLAETSHYRDVFLEAGRFAINILGEDQQNLSDLFASPENDRFSRTEWQPSENNLPLLSNCIATLECQTEHHYAGGDHTILVGRVIDFDYNKQAPLIFSQSAYHTLK